MSASAGTVHADTVHAKAKARGAHPPGKGLVFTSNRFESAQASNATSVTCPKATRHAHKQLNNSTG